MRRGNNGIRHSRARGYKPQGTGGGGDGRLDLVLLPRDGLFLKDGREWGPAGASRAQSLAWPAPSTLLGALRTACGRTTEAAAPKPWEPKEWRDLADASSLGATIALRRPTRRSPGAQPVWSRDHRVWPVPADALFLTAEDGRKTIQRLDPTPCRVPSVGSDDADAREKLWWPYVGETAKPAKPPSWWPEAALVAWLADPQDKRDWVGAFKGLALPRHVQAHVGIEPATQTALDEILFAHEVVETLDESLHEWAIGCRFRARPTDKISVPITLGGDRRLARHEPAQSHAFACPDVLTTAFRGRPPRGIRLMAVTPAAFEQGWCPNGFSMAGDEVHGRLPDINADLILRAAIVPRAAHVSGWDMATGAAKRTTRLVPPGAVYFLAKADPKAVFTDDETGKLWLITLGDRTNEGFGCFVGGLWNPKENG